MLRCKICNKSVGHRAVQVEPQDEGLVPALSDHRLAWQAPHSCRLNACPEICMTLVNALAVAVGCVVLRTNACISAQATKLCTNQIDRHAGASGHIPGDASGASNWNQASREGASPALHSQGRRL